jgi:hypothetical protein
MNFTETIGYLGSILVAISLSMKSVWKLRIINLFGSLFFAIYGYLIGAWPIFVVNSYITLMNVWYLIDFSRNTACLSYDSVKSLGDNYFQRFYSFYEDDIRAFFPEVGLEHLKTAETSVLFRNMLPVGIFSLELQEKGRARVIMDYLVPEFRDFRFGMYIYLKKSYIFRDRNIEILEAITKVKAHKNYLNRLGFEEKETLPDGSWRMEKKI